MGLLWAFIHPSITILIFWFVFQVGFKSTPVDNFPFILWIMAGMIPWFFFSESLSNATYSIIENSFMVKKVVFRVSILPIIKILSALFIHLFFIGVLFVMFAVYGYVPNIYNLQVLYYLFATIVFLMGLSWITSSLVIFLKDIGQMVNMVLQFGFWLTPIFWSIKILPEKYQFIMKLNPIFYLIEGYRNSFIYKVWFWEHYILTLYFWSVTLVIIILGTVLFRKLRPHFADVL
ncbi:MAG: ABC transporter permease [Thermodesulfovibrionia bacterium]|nr:ABC transporter permease [Thermodesulfovibrionia bacterium]